MAALHAAARGGDAAAVARCWPRAQTPTRATPTATRRCTPQPAGATPRPPLRCWRAERASARATRTARRPCTWRCGGATWSARARALLRGGADPRALSPTGVPILFEVIDSHLAGDERARQLVDALLAAGADARGAAVAGSSVQQPHFPPGRAVCAENLSAPKRQARASHSHPPAPSSAPAPAPMFRQATILNVAKVPALIRRVTSGGYEPVKLTEEELIAQRRELLQRSRETVLSDYASKDIDALLLELHTNGATGLTEDEAQKRLLEHGPNELEKKPPTPLWRMFLEQFSDLLVILLIVSACISFGLGSYEASVTIILIVIGNAVLGVVQESRAGKALEALASLSAPKATVLRDGKLVELEAHLLVPGDVVMIPIGCSVPADIRLIESSSMLSNEMALTGESEPAKKNADYVRPAKPHAGGGGGGGGGSGDAAPAPAPAHGEERKEAEGGAKKEKKEEALTDANMIHMGCTITEGQGKGVVVKTGMHTRMGEIAHLLNTSERGMSPLQEKLHRLGVQLGMASIAVSLIVFIVGVTTERGTDPNNSDPAWLQMLLVAVSLTVAAVPEGLPACVTITLAMGMRRMALKNALIRELHSVETLGSATVICSDKTGTLTAGVMTAVRLWFAGTVYRITGAGYSPEGAIVPMDVDERDPQAVAAAAAALRGKVALSPVLIAALSSDARVQRNAEGRWEALGNISERPLVVAAMKAGWDEVELGKRFQRVHTNPFNSARKMMSVVVNAVAGEALWFGGAKFVTCVKGAPNFVLDKCVAKREPDGSVTPMSDADRAAILAQVDAFSEQAFRVLAEAYRAHDEEPADCSPEALERDLVFCGMMASIDPERLEVAPSIRKAYRAGIRVVMITGDYVKTAKAIAENIGLLPRGSPANKAVDCEVIRRYGDRLFAIERALKDEKNPPPAADRENLKREEEKLQQELDAITAYADVYARAKPIDKITIVRSLKRQDNVCSMTGDGVNDAPALKEANIGVAMGITGTDVAKGAANMVLTDDNFCSIVEAIEEGRTIYANISKFVFYLLSTNMCEVLFILIAVLMGLQTPLVPIQILWLNLTTDGAPAIALAVEGTEPGVMDEGPRSRREPLIEKLMLTGIAVQVCALTTMCLVTYVVGLQWETGTWNAEDTGLSPHELDVAVRKARSMSMYYIVFAELLRAYTSRSLRMSVFQIGVLSNRWMPPATITAVCLTIFVGHVPGLRDVFEMEIIGGRDWGWIIGLCGVPALVDELMKVGYRATGFGKRPRARDLSAIATGGVPPAEGRATAYAKVDEEKALEH
jgi:Ca2+-transporting ATPase